ncbi:hypothetical protein B296_00047365 [Ensete ventricosum]|uniref:Uncharacterized protein n=1 Tax=Ensete ventricosum TaxID=4639 RepID=A0A426YZW2_ENSVE|nr:hypothetical protein B296_00047365 [Ensete ventricosum]
MHKSGETPLHKERHACTRTRRFSQNCGQRYALWRSLPISGPETRPGSSWGGVTASPVPGTEKESLALYCLANYQASKQEAEIVGDNGGCIPGSVSVVLVLLRSGGRARASATFPETRKQKTSDDRETRKANPRNVKQENTNLKDPEEQKTTTKT